MSLWQRIRTFQAARQATSNAVERGNRRHRKVQKTVYRVRTRSYRHKASGGVG